MHADLAIAAGGSSIYERCIIGLPSVVFSIADNQIQLSRDIDQFGSHYYVEKHSTFNVAQAIENIQNNLNAYLKKMVEMVDGSGVQHVIKEILK